MATFTASQHICVTFRVVHWRLRSHHRCQSRLIASEGACVCRSPISHNNMFTLVKGKSVELLQTLATKRTTCQMMKREPLLINSEVLHYIQILFCVKEIQGKNAKRSFLYLKETSPEHNKRILIHAQWQKHQPSNNSTSCVVVVTLPLNFSLVPSGFKIKTTWNDLLLLVYANISQNYNHKL